MHSNMGTRGTVLVVDDDPAILVLIQNILAAANYRVMAAVERADALHLAEQKNVHIDVALIDVCMPGVRGSEFAVELRRIRPDIRLLWMSGIVDQEFVRIRLTDASAGFLPKPLQRAGLLSAIEQAVAAKVDFSGEPDGARTMTAGAADSAAG